MRKLVLLAILLYAPSALAVLPPRIARQRRERIYKTARAMQKKAPEVLVIKVISVKAKSYYNIRRTRKRVYKRLKRQDLTVLARVVRVVRSKRRLRKGRRIRFTYTQRFQYQPGPRKYNPRGLIKGQRARVYLRYDPKRSPKLGRYRIAASVLSVVPIKSKGRR